MNRINHKSLRLMALAAVVILAGCAGSKPPLASTSAVTLAPDSQLPTPTRTDLLGNARPYLIGPFDQLRVEVFGVEDLQRNVQTDASGAFSFPLIGRVDALGQTPDQIANLLRQRLAGKYLVDPQVTVNLVQTVSQVMTVDGQVASPGQFPVVGRMTLMRAVAVAGGTKDYADLQDVVVFREVGGQKYAALYNLEAIRRGNYADPEIYANDVIIVGGGVSAPAATGQQGGGGGEGESTRDP